jgi:hypothetical protein
MFKGILELAMFLMSKHILDDNIATSQISSLLVFDTLQIVSTLHRLCMQSTMRQRFLEIYIFHRRYCGKCSPDVCSRALYSSASSNTGAVGI